MPFFTIAFDSDFILAVLYDKVDAIRTNFPLARRGIVILKQVQHDESFKLGFGCSQTVFEVRQFRMDSMANQAEPDVFWFQVSLGIQGMNHPQLVSRSTRSDVVTLLVEIVIPLLRYPPKRAMIGIGGVDHADKHDVAFVPLEGWRDADLNLTIFVLLGFHVLLKKSIDRKRLFLSKHGDDPERLPIIARVFGASEDEGSDVFGLAGVNLVDLDSGRHAVFDHRRCCLHAR
jgi:hypothetical protein